MPTPIDWHGDDDARVRFERVVQQLVDLGCTVETVDAAPIYDAGALMYGSALVAERFAAFGPFALAHPDAMDPAVLEIVRRAGDHRGVGVRERRGCVVEASASWPARRWWSTVDALVVPTVARPPAFAEALRDPFGPSLELGRLTAFVNPLGLAAVAAPTGRRASGRPFGVSLVGPGGTDHGLLELATRADRGDTPSNHRVGAGRSGAERSAPRRAPVPDRRGRGPPRRAAAQPPAHRPGRGD